MDQDLPHLEHLFHNGLEDNEEMPPSQVWDGIDSILDKDNVVSIKKKYVHMKRIALILLLLLGFSIFELSEWSGNVYLVKENGNNPDSSAVGSGNHNIPKSKRSFKAIDSNLLNTRKEIDLDSSVANQNSSLKNALSQSEKISIVGNKATVHNRIANSKHDENDTPNNISENSVMERTFSHHNTMPKSISRQRNSQGVTNRVIADNAPNAKNKSVIIDTSLNGINITNPYLSTSNAKTVVTGIADVANQKSQNLRHLDPVATDKIISPIRDRSSIEKLLQGLRLGRIDTQNYLKTDAESDTHNRKIRQSRFSITPFFSPDVAWYQLQEDKPDNQHVSLAQIEESEKHEFSSTVGALIDYKLYKHWSLQSGLTYSNTNITVEPKTIYAQPDNTGNIKYRINTSSGYGFILPSFSTHPGIGDSLYAFMSTHTLNYIGIPMAVKFHIAEGKVTFNTMAGVSLNFLTKGKVEGSVEKGFSHETEVVNHLQGLKKIYLKGLAGLGVDYKLNAKIALSFAPTYRFALTSINQNAPVKSYPNSFGFVFGLKTTL